MEAANECTVFFQWQKHHHNRKWDAAHTHQARPAHEGSWLRCCWQSSPGLTSYSREPAPSGCYWDPARSPTWGNLLETPESWQGMECPSPFRSQEVQCYRGQWRCSWWSGIPAQEGYAFSCTCKQRWLFNVFPLTCCWVYDNARII